MTHREPELVDVDITSGLVTCDDGEVLPILNYRDEFGDDCDAIDAVSVYAGRDDYGWLSIDIQGRMPFH